MTENLNKVSYPDENNSDAEQEGQFLAQKTASSNEIEINAFVDGKVAGTAGIHAVGTKYKVKHRAEFGISVLKEYGRNPRGFNSRISGFQEVVYMLLAL